MYIKLNGLVSLVATLFLAVATGCSKSDSNPKASTQGGAPADESRTVARLHWLGKKRLATQSNATNFMAIWNLPESTKLEAQTLDKLSTAPWRLLAATTPLAQAPTALLRPLLDDLVQEESYLEVRSKTNQPTALMLAIRLDAVRAALWRTNLPVILKSLSGNRPATSPAQAASATAATSEFRLETPEFEAVVSRTGDWTMLALTDLRFQSPDPRLLELFRSRITTTQTPYLPRTTNYWLEAEADLGVFAGWLPFRSAFRPLPAGFELPRITLNWIGDGQNVRTRGELNFPSPVPIELEPWNIPTNLVHDPLIGFMGVRGIRPWLKALKFWDEAKLGSPPNQAFFWAQNGSAPLHFFAAPSAQASNQLFHLSEYLLNEVNPRFAHSLPTNGIPLGAFERNPDTGRIRWRGVPMISPNADHAEINGAHFIAGGLFSNLVTNEPVPSELLRQFQTEPNLVLYDWEATQPAEYRLIQATQVGRLVFGRSRLSMTNNAALPWLVAISPKLGISGTSIRLTDANRLNLSRSSTLGLTAAELHLLAEWLESPTFPAGLFTLTAKPAPLMVAPAQSPPKTP